MKYEPTAASANEYAKNNKLEEWVHTFLRNEGNNVDFSDGLMLEDRIYFAPKKMSLNLFERCCGPEKGMKFQIPSEGFYKNVEAIAEKFKNSNWDMPPLIIFKNNGKYELNDGNHRYEALRTLGIDRYWIILWKTADPQVLRRM